MTTPLSPIQSEIQRVAEKFTDNRHGLYENAEGIRAILKAALTELATPLQQRVDLAETSFQTAQKQVADLMNDNLGLQQKVEQLEVEKFSAWSEANSLKLENKVLREALEKISNYHETHPQWRFPDVEYYAKQALTTTPQPAQKGKHI